MKKIVILGATGSVGMQTVDVICQHKDEFEIVGLSVGKNINGLKKILSKVTCNHVCVMNGIDVDQLKTEYPSIHFYFGEDGLIDIATLKDADIVLNALVGFVGLKPTLQAIEAKKDIALANKETLVVAGEFVLKACRDNNVQLYPVDSELSAIFQCLQGNERKDIKNLILTASGGSFRNLSREELKGVTIAEALDHPNWSMGAKITIDSATMMNKGFEVMETHWLFDIDYNKIKVLMHDESIVHSMVEYKDNSFIAQLATADMRIPIQYAIAYPKRLNLETGESLDLASIGALHFSEASVERFPLLKLAYDVGEKGGNLPAVMNAANEEANLAFRNGKISFLDIEKLVIEACEDVEYKKDIKLKEIFIADQWARKYVKGRIENQI